MMLVAIEAMTYSDFVLLNYLRKLAKVGEEFTLSHTQVASDTGIPYITVSRAMSRLEKAGAVTRRPGFANVYIYRVNHE